jgi:(S)-citramalyl-CoA lyase
MPTNKARRSLVLVTGANAGMLDAALRSEADVVCLDFEDTVKDKAAAHALVPRLFDGASKSETAIRINPLSEPEGLRDLLLLRQMARLPNIVKMAKVSDPFEVQLAAGMLPGVDLMVIIETAEALERAAEIARSSPSVCGLLMGGKDLSEALGCARTWNGLLYARGRVAHAAATAGIAAYDEPYRPLDDLKGLAETCGRLVEMGYRGKTTVDLGQVPVINEQFANPR